MVPITDCDAFVVLVAVTAATIYHDHHTSKRRSESLLCAKPYVGLFDQSKAYIVFCDRLL